MTEYWVSQGNKWCEFCKIYIANNPASIRTHEFGQKHKDNVAKKLAAIRKENAAKEKERQQALKDLARIEAQAKRSYEKDLAASKRLESSTAPATSAGAPNTSAGAGTLRSDSGEWSYDEATGYYFNSATGYYYDSNSGLYYSELLGKWTTQEEAFRASKESAAGSGTDSVTDKPRINRVPPESSVKPPGPVLQPSQLKAVPRKGVASSLDVGKRKREVKAESLSKEETAALAAREAAKKRVQEREKGFLGLYQSY